MDAKENHLLNFMLMTTSTSECQHGLFSNEMTVNVPKNSERETFKDGISPSSCVMCRRDADNHDIIPTL